MREQVQRIAKRLIGLVARRPGFAVGIWGEPGIGKTHTVKTLLNETPCRNLSLHATTTAVQLTEALPRPAKIPIWAERTLERMLNGEHVETLNLTNALGATLSGLAPFVLHLEDIHEVTSLQLELIESLARIVSRLKGVGLIVTSREQPPESFEAIRLEPLSSQTVQEMLKAEVGAELPAEALEWIQARAAGNPLFALEFFRFLARQGFVWSDGQRWRWRAPPLESMPVSVETLIEQVIARTIQEPKLEDVIQAKAVLGRNTDMRLWAEVSSVTLEVLEASKIDLERDGILHDLEFSHPLYAEVIARKLTTEKRQVFARRAIKALENNPNVAAGFVDGAKLEPEHALKILLLAAKELELRGENLSAAQLRAQALQYATGKTRSQLALDAARGLIKSPDITKALMLLEEVSSSSKEFQNTALELMAECHARANNGSAMNAIIERLPTAYRNTVAWFAKYIQMLFESGNGQAVIEHWQLHPEHWAAPKGETIYHVGYCLIHSGDLSAAQTLANEFLLSPNLSAEDQASTLEVLATAAFYAGNYTQADALFSQLLLIFDVKKNTKDYSNCLRNRAVTRLSLGVYQASLPDFQESIRLDFERGLPIICAQTKVMVSAVYLETGAFEQTEKVLLEALEVLETIPPEAFLVHGLIALALLYLRWQRPLDRLLAKKYALECLQIAQNMETPVLQAVAFLCYSEVETQTGNPERGLEYAEKSLNLADQIGFSENAMNAHVARANALLELGRKNEAFRDLQAAESICLETGLVLELQKTLLEIDRLNNDSKGAKLRLEWFEAKGFITAANTARKYFPELNTNSPDVFTPTINTKLEVLGTMQIVAANSSVPVRGQKRRELLALLLEARIAGRHEISRLELLDVLYPNTFEEQANGLLKNLVFQVRELCGSSGVITTESGYALGEVSSDAEDFLETGNTNLWRGMYLEGLSFESNNQTVRESLHLALRNRLGQILETDTLEAVRIGRLLCDAEPYDLEALRFTIKALRQAKNHKAISRLYTNAKDQFLEIGEVLPERWQDFLETQIGETV